MPPERISDSETGQPPRIVLDTNVVVSGLLKPGSLPAQILHRASQGKIILIYDERILDEYARVLVRPKLGLPADLTREWLDLLPSLGLLIDAPPALEGISANDPSDLPFAEVALAAGAALVTGNARHFTFLAALQVPVFSPAEFLRTYPESTVS